MGNKNIILTRPHYEADNIRLSLEASGLEVIAFPMIEIKALSLSESDKQIFKQIADYQQIVFTSKNGVKHFFEQGSFQKQDLQSARFACIGETTAKALQEQGFTAEIVAEGTSKEFLPLLQSKFVNPQEKLLLVQGKLAPDFLLKELQALCPTRLLQVYNTVAVKDYSTAVVERIRKDDYSILLFTSPSAFKRFLEIMNESHISAPFRIACIGNVTAAAVQEAGIEPVFIASKTKGEELAKELIEFLEKQ